MLPVIFIEFLLNIFPSLPIITAKTFCFPDINFPGIVKDHELFKIFVDEVSFPENPALTCAPPEAMPDKINWPTFIS